MKLQLFCLFVAAAVSGSNAVDKESQIATRTYFIPLVTECAKGMEFPIDNVKKADADNKLETLEGCLVACIFKKAGIINKEGNLDLESSTQLITKLLKGDDLKKALEINEGCMSVNEKPVTDGAKGCDRAKLLIQCYGEHKNEFRLV